MTIIQNNKTEKIKTYVVTGFLCAGKSTYIQSYIRSDFFHKREKGDTLILAFEEGETPYDTGIMKEHRTGVSFFNRDEGLSVSDFIKREIHLHKPDRIFAEANCMMPDLYDTLRGELDVVSTTMLIDGSTLDLYYVNMLQMLQDMISVSDPVFINRAADKEVLDKYSGIFRLMNPGAGFLWESPTGHHERIFGNVLPFDISQQEIYIREQDFPLWYLDGLEFPDNYSGKTIEGDFQIKTYSDADEVKAGRLVMTCCMNDISFLGFKLKADGFKTENNTFAHIRANVTTESDPVYKRKRLVLNASELTPVPQPAGGLVIAYGRGI